MFNEVARVAQERWGHPEELLALICERLDLLVRITVMAHRDPKKSPPRFGEQFAYPRPGRPAAQQSGPVVVRPREIAMRMLGGG